MDMRVHEPVSHPMPEIAAFVAQMKSAFGEQEINEVIRRGKAGRADVLRRRKRSYRRDSESARRKFMASH